ncbi:MAG: GNAT family N-acetyltransferase [Bacteroidia bacterium]|nr:GNAT family N-acetyltransferase [Bacteroidia bacterium]
MFLKGNNISLRPMEISDVDVLYEWENNTELWHVSNTQAPLSKNVLLNFIEDSQYDIYTVKQIRLMVVENAGKKTVGAIDLYDYDPQHDRVGVGIYIHNEFTGRGYAAESLALVTDYCFKHLYVKQIHSLVNVTNEASIRLFEKAGFEKTGLKKAWIKIGYDTFEDAIFFQKIRE